MEPSSDSSGLIGDTLRRVRNSINYTHSTLQTLMVDDESNERTPTSSGRTTFSRFSSASGSLSYSRSHSPSPATPNRLRVASATPIGRCVSAMGLSLKRVEATRVIERQEKNLVFKHVLALNGPFGTLMRDVQEIPLISSSVSCGVLSTVCRTGKNSVLITSHTVTPQNATGESEQKWCFGSEGGMTAHDLELPLIPTTEFQASVNNGTTKMIKINVPYNVIIQQKISHGKRTKVAEVIEIRSNHAMCPFMTEVFSEPCDRKTEKLAYNERVFVGDGIIRIVTESTVFHEKLDITSITRHMWSCDLSRDKPIMITGKEVSPPRVNKDFSLNGALSDTSAGSGSPSPDAKNSVMEKGPSQHNLNPSTEATKTSKRTPITSTEVKTVNQTNLGTNASTLSVMTSEIKTALFTPTTKKTQNERTSAASAKNLPLVKETGKVFNPVQPTPITHTTKKSPDEKSPAAPTNNLPLVKETEQGFNPIGYLSSMARSFFPWFSTGNSEDKKTEPSTHSKAKTPCDTAITPGGLSATTARSIADSPSNAYTPSGLSAVTALSIPTTPGSAGIATPKGAKKAPSIQKTPQTAITPGVLSATTARSIAASPSAVAYTPGGTAYPIPDGSAKQKSSSTRSKAE